MPVHLTEILDVLREHDPEHLIALGCPDDEYLPEAEPILWVLWERPLTKADLLRIWVRYFAYTSDFLAPHADAARADLLAALNALRR